MANPDVSPGAVTRAVLRATLQKPYVLYPTAVGIVGSAAALALGPTLPLILPAVLGLGIGVGSWVLDATLRREKHANAYLQTLRDQLAGRIDQAVARLDEELTAQAFPPGRAQLDQLRSTYDAFEVVLASKLDRSEITFSRYLAIAEQVFLGALDNLQRIADTRRALATIDPDYIRDRLQALASDGIQSAAQDAETRSLRERQALHDQQSEQIHHWLAENDAAMTRINLAMASIAKLDTHATKANMRLDDAMRELQALAERAPSYSRSPPT